MKRLLITMLLLSGCASNIPEYKVEPDLRIHKLDLPKVEEVSPLEVPIKPKGTVHLAREVDGVMILVPDGAPRKPGDVKIMTFKANEVKRLNLLYNAAKGNSELVKELNVSQKLIGKYSENLKALAELEEARAARLEADLHYSEYRTEKLRKDKNIEIWSWKIFATLGLLIGL